MRIELYRALLAGFAGGMVGTLWSGLVTGPLFARWPALRPGSWAPETAARLLTGTAIYGIGGALAGLLFWLSWGLVAVVAAPWALVGATFGALVFAAGGLPALGALALAGRRGRGALVVFGIEAFVAAVAAGVSCAWAWQRS